jgi:polyhydroxybutyrate depolymerase
MRVLRKRICSLYGGHTWPGGKNREWVVGDTSEEFSANEMMWEFFQKHPMP